MESLKHPVVLACMAVAVILVLTDFFQRVYSPLSLTETRSEGVSVAAIEAAFERQSLPSHVLAWLNQIDAAEQARIAAETSAEDTQQATQVSALPGSESLDIYQVRVRAVFIQRYQDDSQFLAVGEVQATEGPERGEIKRRVFRPGDTVGEFAVQSIEPGIVHFGGPAEQQVSVRVFNPLHTAPASLGEQHAVDEQGLAHDDAIDQPAEPESATQATGDLFEQFDTSGMSEEEIEEFKMLLELRRQNRNDESEN